MYADILYFPQILVVNQYDYQAGFLTHESTFTADLPKYKYSVIITVIYCLSKLLIYSGETVQAFNLFPYYVTYLLFIPTGQISNHLKYIIIKTSYKL